MEKPIRLSPRRTWTWAFCMSTPAAETMRYERFRTATNLNPDDVNAHWRLGRLFPDASWRHWTGSVSPIGARRIITLKATTAQLHADNPLGYGCVGAEPNRETAIGTFCLIRLIVIVEMLVGREIVVLNGSSTPFTSL